jgi:hypothetical protein
MTEVKEGFTDDMAQLLVDDGGGDEQVAALFNFRFKTTSDDSEVHVCGQRLPWTLFEGKEHIEFDAESIMLTKVEFFERFKGATSTHSNGVRYKQRYGIKGEITSPRVGLTTPHKMTFQGYDCLINEPEVSWAQGDGVILQSISGMCANWDIAEQEPSDT